MLEKHGASLKDQDYSGSTALHWAVDGGNIEVVRWLLKNGCLIDVKDYTSGEIMRNQQGRVQDYRNGCGGARNIRGSPTPMFLSDNGLRSKVHPLFIF